MLYEFHQSYTEVEHESSFPSKTEYDVYSAAEEGNKQMATALQR